MQRGNETLEALEEQDKTRQNIAFLRLPGLHGVLVLFLAETAAFRLVFILPEASIHFQVYHG